MEGISSKNSSFSEVNSAPALSAVSVKSQCSSPSETVSGTVSGLPQIPASSSENSLGDSISEVFRGLDQLMQDLMKSFNEAIQKSWSYLNTAAKTAPADKPSDKPTGTASPSPTSPGSSPTTTMHADSAPRLKRTGRFLWRPVADKDGKAVVLLPPQFQNAKEIHILSPDGKTILEVGKLDNNLPGRKRAHYRFSKAGSDYPKGAIIEIVKGDGSIVHEKIKRPSRKHRR